MLHCSVGLAHQVEKQREATAQIKDKVEVAQRKLEEAKKVSRNPSTPTTPDRRANPNPMSM